MFTLSYSIKATNTQSRVNLYKVSHFRTFRQTFFPQTRSYQIILLRKCAVNPSNGNSGKGQGVDWINASFDQTIDNTLSLELIQWKTLLFRLKLTFIRTRIFRAIIRKRWKISPFFWRVVCCVRANIIRLWLQRKGTNVYVNFRHFDCWI